MALGQGDGCGHRGILVSDVSFCGGASAPASRHCSGYRGHSTARQYLSISTAAEARVEGRSAESRAIAVTQYYTGLLHRTAPPTQAEVSGWVNSPPRSPEH